MSNKISVLLVDDHALVRKGFRRMIEDDSEIRVVGEASSGIEAVQLCQQLKPQVIVMDMAMPGLDGIEALVLESIGLDFLDQADAAALLGQVDQHARPLLADHLQDGVQPRNVYVAQIRQLEVAQRGAERVRLFRQNPVVRELILTNPSFQLIQRFFRFLKLTVDKVRSSFRLTLPRP